MQQGRTLGKASTGSSLRGYVAAIVDLDATRETGSISSRQQRLGPTRHGRALKIAFTYSNIAIKVSSRFESRGRNLDRSLQPLHPLRERKLPSASFELSTSRVSSSTRARHLLQAFVRHVSQVRPCGGRSQKSKALCCCATFSSRLRVRVGGTGDLRPTSFFASISVPCLRFARVLEIPRVDEESGGEMEREGSGIREGRRGKERERERGVLRPAARLI